MLNPFSKNKATPNATVATAPARAVAAATAPYSVETDPQVLNLQAEQAAVAAEIQSARQLMSDAMNLRNVPAEKLQALHAANEAHHLAAAESATLTSDADELARYEEIALHERELRRIDDRIKAIEKITDVKALEERMQGRAIAVGELMRNLRQERLKYHKDDFLVSLVTLIFTRFDLMESEGLAYGGFSAASILPEVEHRLGDAIREVEILRLNERKNALAAE